MAVSEKMTDVGLAGEADGKTGDEIKDVNVSEKNQESYTVDELFDRLGEVLKKMESRENSLEESFACYREGIVLLEQCKEALDLVEKKVMQLDQNGDTHEFS